MSVKELREVAKGYNVAGRWDMTKAQLVEAIEKIENEKAAAKKAKKEVKAKKESSKEKVMKVQRALWQLVRLVRKFTVTSQLQLRMSMSIKPVIISTLYMLR